MIGRARACRPIWDGRKLSPACRSRLVGSSRGFLFEVVVGLASNARLKAMGSRVGAIDIRSALPPIKEGAAIYDATAWRKLMAEILRERGRVCEDPHHNYNRTHRLKNALPDPASLGRIYGDHIVELADGGAPFDKSNVLLRCAVCHGRKTAAAGIARRTTKHKSNSTTIQPPTPTPVVA